MLGPLLLAAVLTLALDSPKYGLLALMSPVMLIGNAVLGRLSPRNDYIEQLRGHNEHKTQVEGAVRQALVDERSIRRKQAPDPAQALLIATGPRSRLWERRRGDSDYLVLRVATANLPSEVRLSYAEASQEPRGVVSQAIDAPVTVSLIGQGVIGLAGRRERIAPLAAWMTAQVAVLHSPRDVRLYILSDEGGRADWEWVRWLPHCRPEQRSDAAVLIGNDADSIARRLGELAAEIAARTEAHSGASAPALPSERDIVVVLDGARRLRSLPGVDAAAEAGSAVGIYCCAWTPTSGCSPRSAPRLSWRPARRRGACASGRQPVVDA